MARQNNALDTLPRQFRVGGSGFTAFQWKGHVIGFAQSVEHTGPQPVAPPSPIQPLDQQYPMQILVPAAIGAGTLRVQLFEMYNRKVWDQIMKITDTLDPSSAGARDVYNDLSEIFLRLSALANPITCTKIVYPPGTGVRGGPGVRHYADVYHNCMVTDIRDDEIIEIGTMEVIKNMTIMYTHTRRIHDSRSN
jgi:hypothetical protein